MDTAHVEMSAADLQLAQQHRQQIAAEIEEHQRRRNAAVRSILMCKNLSYLDMIRTMKRNHEDDIKMILDSQREEIEDLKTSYEKEVFDLESRYTKDIEEEMRVLQWTLEERLPQRVRELMEVIPVFEADEVEAEAPAPDAESAPDADVLELAGFADTQAIREGADAVVEDAEVDSEEEERERRRINRQVLRQSSQGETNREHLDFSPLDASDVIDDADEEDLSDNENDRLNHSFGSATTGLVSDEDEDHVDAETAAAATRETIKTLREQNEQCTANGFRFSRICPICSDSPLHRAVFTSCGHSICLACAEEIKLVAEESEEVDLACPMCREEGEFVKLWEQRLDQDST